MARRIPDEMFTQYMAAKMRYDIAKLRVNVLANKIRNLEERGYEHPQLSFKRNTAWRPDWRKIAMELISRLYRTAGPRSVFMKTLRKRFPMTKGKKSLTILAPRYVKHAENVVALKKKLKVPEEV